MNIKPEHKEWAIHLRNHTPGDAPRILHYKDDRSGEGVDVFLSEYSGRHIASTIGVMDENQSKQEGKVIYSEILFDSNQIYPEIGNIASNTAFFIMNDKWKIAPGVVFEDIVSKYLNDLKVKHICFAPPFQWKNTMSKVELGTKTIYPLLALPITDEEDRCIQSDGFEALEDFWIKKKTNLFDWERS